MRRSILRWAMALAATLMPAWVMASDQETAQHIADALRGSGRLVDYSIGVKYENGTAWLLGRVANEDQAREAIEMAEQLPVVQRVVNSLEIKPTRPNKSAPTVAAAAPVAKPANTSFTNFFTKSSSTSKPSAPLDPLNEQAPSQNLAPVAEPPRGEQVAASRMTKLQSQLKSALGLNATQQQVQAEAQLMAYEDPSAEVQQVAAQQPIRQTAATAQQPTVAAARAPQRVATRPAAPRPIARVAQANVGGPTGPAPAPMMASHHGAANYDHPQMPGHAWPSYAAYPNYAGVTYPKQYSPTAWPYIGPFYPYPQVPLGWRKVTLEWDDGWWFLDFSNRREARCR